MRGHSRNSGFHVAAVPRRTSCHFSRRRLSMIRLWPSWSPRCCAMMRPSKSISLCRRVDDEANGARRIILGPACTRRRIASTDGLKADAPDCVQLCKALCCAPGVLALSPNDLNALNNRAIALRELGRLEQAMCARGATILRIDIAYTQKSSTSTPSPSSSHSKLSQRNSSSSSPSGSVLHRS
jgi:hypothetical protein